eukprot:Opistho-2@60221
MADHSHPPTASGASQQSSSSSPDSSHVGRRFSLLHLNRNKPRSGQKNVLPNFMHFGIDAAMWADISLENDDDQGQSIDDLLSHSSSKLLNKYSTADIMHQLDCHGIVTKLRAMGIDNIHIIFELADPFVHKVTIKYIPTTPLHTPTADHTSAVDAERSDVQKAELMICEIYLRRLRSAANLKAMTATDEHVPGGHLVHGLLTAFQDFDMVAVEWMRMQNPTKQFSKERSALPGQDHPSLGIGREVEEMLADMATRSARDAITNVPLYFHNALFYSSPGYKFVDPEFEGKFRTLVADVYPDIKEHGLSAVSFAVVHGRLFCDGRRAVVPATAATADLASKVGAVTLSASHGHSKIASSEHTSNAHGLAAVSENGEDRVHHSVAVPPATTANGANGSGSTHRGSLAGMFGVHRHIESIAERRANAVRVLWLAEEMMRPLSLRMKNYFEGKEYRDILAKNTSSGVFFIDWDASLPSNDDWAHARKLRLVNTLADFH